MGWLVFVFCVERRRWRVVSPSLTRGGDTAHQWPCGELHCTGTDALLGGNSVQICGDIELPDKNRTWDILMCRVAAQVKANNIFIICKLLGSKRVGDTPGENISQIDKTGSVHLTPSLSPSHQFRWNWFSSRHNYSSRVMQLRPTSTTFCHCQPSPLTGRLVIEF